MEQKRRISCIQCYLEITSRLVHHRPGERQIWGIAALRSMPQYFVTEHASVMFLYRCEEAKTQCCINQKFKSWFNRTQVRSAW